MITFLAYAILCGIAAAVYHAILIAPGHILSKWRQPIERFGTSEVSLSLASVGNPDTGWVNLAAGAIANDVFVRVLMSGGDGALDPVAGPLLMFLR